MNNFGEKVSFIWSVADLLRGPYRPNQYKDVMLPMTVLRRLDCVLEPTKDRVHAKLKTLEGGKVKNVEPLLCRVTGVPFFNTSRYTFEKLKGDPNNIAANLTNYIKGFSTRAREIIEHFDFEEHIAKLDKADRLFLLVSKFCEIDLHPDRVSNIEMGYIFEELIRRFNEASNEEAGDHFTPREVIRLMVNLLFLPDSEILTTKGIVEDALRPSLRDRRHAVRPVAVGSRAAHAEKIELSQLIDILNERFGTDFKPGDQLFLESIREDAVADPEIRQAALANTMENFGYVFLKALEGIFIERMEQNEDITARFMNDQEFQDVVGKHLLKKVYEQVRGEQARQQTAGRKPFQRVTPKAEDKYRTCVPLNTLKAAAGAFGESQEVEPEGWVVPSTTRPLSQGMFVAQVVGRSMEPAIPDAAWCLFRSPVTGTRQGRTVLVQHRSIHDPETGGSYTVKRYESDKVHENNGSWRHQVIRLVSANPDFPPIVLETVPEGEVAVIAELVEVLR